MYQRGYAFDTTNTMIENNLKSCHLVASGGLPFSSVAIGAANCLDRFQDPSNFSLLLRHIGFGPGCSFFLDCRQYRDDGGPGESENWRVQPTSAALSYFDCAAPWTH